MFGLGMQEVLIILLIAIILFGARKLPEIGAGLGKAIRNFKHGVMEPDEAKPANTAQKQKEQEYKSEE